MGGLTDVREVKGDAMDAPELVIEGRSSRAGIAVQSELDEDAAWAGAAEWGQGWRMAGARASAPALGQRKRMGWSWKRDGAGSEVAEAVDDAGDAVADAAADASEKAGDAAASLSEALDEAGDAAAKAEFGDGARPELSARDRMVEMGESRTPRPEPFVGDHYERVRWFVVDRPNGHRHPAGRSSHVPLDRA